MDADLGAGGVQHPTLEQLDAWCEAALSAPAAEARDEAERRLRYFFPTFSETLAELEGAYGHSGAGQDRVMAVFPAIKGPADAAQLMTWFLHQTTQVLSLTYIVRRLRTLVLNHLGVMSPGQAADLRASLFSAARDRLADKPAFLVGDATRTLALVVMFTWFDTPEARGVIDEVVEGAAAAAVTEQRALLGLQMLRAFVEEFNHELPPKYISRQRRVVVTFRDKQLRAIYEHALGAMRKAIEVLALGRVSDDDEAVRARGVLSQALLLQKECLAFDFIGLAPDEASDEAVAIQIPSTWKDQIQTDGFLDAYFDGYKRSAPPISSQFMDVLVQVASIRRSFYMEAVRVAFVKRMSEGIAEILAGAIGLEDVDNYHHLCRLLARFRCIHTLIEIEDAPVYRTLLAAAAAFTMTGLTLWEWSPNSMAPLLTFWAKVAASFDARDAANTEIAGDVIAQTLPRVVREYLRAMILATSRAAAGESLADPPLEDTDALLENMAFVASIARASYAECSAVVLETLREMAGKYQDALRTGQGGHEAIAVMEGQLAWPVYAAAQCIAARQPYRSQGDDDERDAELFATGLELDRLVQRRIQSGAVAAPPCEALELAFIQLHVAFRASYIGEQGYKTTAVYARLGALVGLHNASAVLDLILQKILFALRTWPPQSPVIQRSLLLFHDMTAGYVCVRQITQLDTAKMLLRSHSSDQFQFLHSVDEYKPRAMYYGGLARLLFTTDAVQPAQFAEFMQPWFRAADELLALGDAQLAQAPVRPGLVRTLRDLRGFLAAVSSKPNYVRFFEWLYPARIRLVQRAVQMAGDVPVQIAALKFMAELVYNRTQRMSFDVSSANGILIFREASQAIWEYCSAVLRAMGPADPGAAPGAAAVPEAAAPQPVRDIYKERYKGVAVCFTILARLISGKYVAIGVMPLYGDAALDRAYSVVLEVLRRFPAPDVIAYPKLGKAAMAVLEVLLAKGTIDLVPLAEPTYEQIMRLCVEAFDHAETTVSSSACTVIDSVLSAAIEGAETGRVADLAALVHRRTDIVQYLLRTILNIVLFEDRPNDWSFSRPLFCLMVLDREFALQHTAQIVQYQPPERRDALVAALKELLSAAEYVLTTKNRDLFTQALTHYRREATAKNLILMVPTTQTLGAPVDILKHDPGDSASGTQEMAD
ncbi:hypothetical protein H4R18_001130 [Coemansia javaensis]|uniref:Exportin-7/Ran-binding protein 17 TPR repeats domain-containing protein n=1 Tax=Coemansia javaensis TaxID=2761396 RepID=A0A9W8LM16_9FUNG|nr:hypothetical protein H4R18_001130 [Coemansia javaensis]